jgi:hypothetical protein
MFWAVFNDFPCTGALGGSGDVEDAGLDATGAEATPVRVCQA